MVTKITTHIQDAKNRLLQQFKGKEGFEKILDAIVGQLQTLEDVFFDLLENRFLDTASGQQLDGIGEIVLLDRPEGLTDTVYRTRLKVQILVLISNGEPETLIQIFKLLLGASSVHLTEISLAALQLLSDVDIPVSDEALIFSILESAAVGGVRINQIGSFDPVGPFVTDGNSLFGKGFGTIIDPLIGGKFATIIRPKPLFAFDGANDDNEGFGTVLDPILGGVFKSA